jgi:hypothetical protein
MNDFQFTFNRLRDQLQAALDNNYTFLRCIDYLKYKREVSTKKVLINRIDVDVSLKKAKRLVDLFNDLGIKGTFFIRLHANEYNPFSFEHYKILKYIRDSDHEIGYHSEIIDQSVIWNELAEECLKKDIAVLNRMLDINVKGVASHGGMTGLNNLDFWKDRKPADFGLLYEAYDSEPQFNLFYESFYISDSNWTTWKCYNKGNLIQNDNRSLGEHVRDGHTILYSLIHPETFYESHFYE